MLAHLIVGTIAGISAASAVGFAGAGMVGILAVYAVVGALGLVGSGMIAMMREDALEARLQAAV